MTDYFFRPFKELIGGSDGSLDAKDGSNLKDGDGAFTINSTGFYVHRLNATSGVSESSPTIIKPDTNAGDKRWIRVPISSLSTLIDFIQSGTSAITRSAQDKMREVVSVTDFGTNAAAFNSAFASVASGGKVIVPAGSYTVASGVIVMSQSNITLEIQAGAVINNTTGTDFTIKITGDGCIITGPGTIQVPNSPAIGASSLTALRKAIIWNTGNKTRIEGVTFQNSISFGIFNEGGNNLKVNGNMFYGGYTAYDVGSGNNHFPYYQDGGSYNEFCKNYVEYWVMGFGSGTFNQSPGHSQIITENFFDHLGQHPVYITNGGDNSIVSFNKQKDCGSSFALDGTGFEVIGNNIHLDSSLWTTGTTYQSGLGMRNSSDCVVSKNIFSGVAHNVVLSFENVQAGTSITYNTVSENTIKMASGTCYAAIRIGSAGVSTDVSYNKITGNTCKVPIESGFEAVGVINLAATTTNQVSYNKIESNIVELVNTSTAIGVVYGFMNKIKKNSIFNPVADGAIIGVSLTYETNSIIESNDMNNIVVIGTTFYGIKEVGTNAQVYSNQYINNAIYSLTTGANYLALVLIAGNSSQVKGLIGSESYDINSMTTFRLHNGTVFCLTASGGNRNFNPSTTDVWPIGYQIDVYNTDGANTITFDSAGLNKSIAANKHGIFVYNGSAWKGSVVD